ncbi:MAG: alpha-amylase/4-alpha-glucanotransferase domain-containing protein, partial [Thermodesulfobacteriota bacterium]
AMNVLTRWPEAYHHKIEALDDNDDRSVGVESIHNAVKSKEKNIKRFLVKDTLRRSSLVDYLVASHESAADFASGNLRLGHAFAGAPYEAKIKKSGVVLRRTASVDEMSITLSKEVRSDGTGGFALASTVKKAEASLEDGCRYGIEFNILLPGCDGPNSSLEVTPLKGPPAREGLSSPHEFEEVSALSVVDGFTGAAFSIDLARAASLWTFPIYTVTLSEAGFERCFQGSSILLLFALASEAEEDDVFKLKFSLHKTGPE